MSNNTSGEAGSMHGVYLKIYVPEKLHIKGCRAYDWLLLTAKDLGLQRGAVFRTIASLDNEGELRDADDPELKRNPSVAVEFALTEAESSRFLERLNQENVNVFYIKVPIEFGYVPDETVSNP